MHAALARLLPLALLIAALGLAACDSDGDDDAFDMADYLGAAYTGQVELEVERPDGTGQSLTYNGTARFTTGSGHTVTLTVNVDAPEAEPLVFSGTYDDAGMRFTLGGSSFTVRDGRVSGTGRIPFFDTTLDATADGTLTPTRLDVDFEAEVVSGGSEDAPDGSTVALELDMRR